MSSAMNHAKRSHRSYLGIGNGFSKLGGLLGKSKIKSTNKSKHTSPKKLGIFARMRQRRELRRKGK